MNERRTGGKDTRSALLGAAAGLLEERGIEAVTLRAVGERAGVSRQAPYKHFADKEASVVGGSGRVLRAVGAGDVEDCRGGWRGTVLAAAGDGGGLRAVRAGGSSPLSSDVRGEDAEESPSRGARGGPRPLRGVRQGCRGLPGGRGVAGGGSRSGSPRSFTPRFTGPWTSRWPGRRRRPRASKTLGRNSICSSSISGTGRKTEAEFGYGPQVSGFSKVRDAARGPNTVQAISASNSAVA